jgi:hypothetical protein
LDANSVSSSDDQSAQLCLMVSEAAMCGLESPRSMRLM